MKHPHVPTERPAPGKNGFSGFFPLAKLRNIFPRILAFLFLIPLICSISNSSSCHADDMDGPVAGFLIPKNGDGVDEKSLIAGFSLFFREKSVNPSSRYIEKYYDNSEESLLASLAELMKTPGLKAVIAPNEIRGTQQVIDATAASDLLVFVTHPSVRFISGELCRPNIFRATANTYVSSQPLARWAFLNLGHKVFIVNEDSEVANEQGDFFALGMEKIGGSFGDRYIIRKDAPAYEDIFERIREVKPDFVFAALSNDSASAFVKAFQDFGTMSKIPLIGSESLTAYPLPLKSIGDKAVGVRTLSSIKNPVNLANDLKGELPGAINLEMVAQGYDIANLIFSCIQKGVFTGGHDQKPHECIMKQSVEGLRGLLRFDANGEAIVPMAVVHWETDPATGFKRIIDEQPEPFRSIDFGCGGVGFPDRPEPLSAESNQGLWEEHQQ